MQYLMIGSRVQGNFGDGRTRSAFAESPTLLVCPKVARQACPLGSRQVLTCVL